MKAAVLHQYDPSLTNQEFVTLEEVEEPHLEKSTDVIVRIGGAGVCRTDLHVIEGIWRQKVDVKLPYVMGHENAGWVEEVGKGVEGFKRGDAVICHPLISNCHALEARRGHDMHVDGSEFPGINTNGGYAELLRTGASSLIKLPQTLAPKDVAPQADAGLTAYHVWRSEERSWERTPLDYIILTLPNDAGSLASRSRKKWRKLRRSPSPPLQKPWNR